MTASSTRPYMIRAIYEWCNDNGFTPYIAVSVDERTVVPMEHVRAGEIVLNLSSSATNKLTLGNDLVHFYARFSGVVRELSIPVDNITAIYARENGHGMAFEVAKPLAETPREAPAGAVAETVADSGIRKEIRISPILGSVPASPTPGSAQKSASVTSLPGPKAKPSKSRAIVEVIEEITEATKDKPPGKPASPDANPPLLSTDDDTPDPDKGPSGPGERTGGRSGTKGRAKLTRIK